MRHVLRPRIGHRLQNGWSLWLAASQKIHQRMRRGDGGDKGVSDCFAPNFSSCGLIKFESSEFMLKTFRGHRFMFNGNVLFHNIDKRRLGWICPEEV